MLLSSREQISSHELSAHYDRLVMDKNVPSKTRFMAMRQTRTKVKGTHGLLWSFRLQIVTKQGSSNHTRLPRDKKVSSLTPFLVMGHVRTKEEVAMGCNGQPEFKY